MHAAALGVTPLVRFLGAREDLPAVLAAADIGWSPRTAMMARSPVWISCRRVSPSLRSDRR
jgi:hypothetical protein